MLEGEFVKELQKSLPWLSFILIGHCQHKKSKVLPDWIAKQYYKTLYKIYIIKLVLARYCPTNVVSVLILPISVSFTDTSSPRFQGGIWQPSKMNKLFKGASTESVYTHTHTCCILFLISNSRRIIRYEQWGSL